MATIVTKKEIKEIFDEYIDDGGFTKDKRKKFEKFIKFLRIDVYDWVRENLKYFFTQIEE